MPPPTARPDGIVAWRTAYEATDPFSTLITVLERLLSRPEPRRRVDTHRILRTGNRRAVA
ncbi:MAG TPA: hypothetical protein VHZ97_06585 [Pseudonocardiaceae bacterium]|jgi:hypothetical protein|nr:hypothetical protein [Pseudonocardiaceae bacterium]